MPQMSDSNLESRYTMLRNRLRRRDLSARLLFDLGVLYVEQLNQTHSGSAKEILFRQAVFYFATAHQIAPTDPEIATFMAQLFLERGNPMLAMAILVPALQGDASTRDLERVRDAIEQQAPNVLEAALARPAAPFSFLTSYNLDSGEFFTLFLGIFDRDAIDFVPTYEVENMGSHLTINSNLLISELHLRQIDDVVHFICKDIIFNIFFYSISNITLTWKNLRPETLFLIKQSVNTQIILIGYDIAKSHYERIMATLAPWVDIIHALDWPLSMPAGGPSGAHVIQGFAPVDARIFFNDDRPRDIDISLIGKVTGHYGFRQDLIDKLSDAGLAVEVAGGNNTTVGKMEYADLFRRSKITLNLSWARNSAGGDAHPFLDKSTMVSHLKLRVLEALSCGCLLLEDKNPNTRAVLSPGEHYVEYTFDTVVDLTRYYLAHETERSKIARAGTSFAVDRFAASLYWGKIRSLVRAGRANWRGDRVNRAFVTKSLSTETQSVPLGRD